MKFIFYFLLTLVLVSCGNKDAEVDAYGNFMATEIVISAESSGKIILKNVNDGKRVTPCQIAYVIDTTQSYLKKQELLARRRAVVSKKANIRAQIAVLNEQDISLEMDIERFGNMLKEGAVSQKQLDDLNTKSTVIKKQIEQVKTNFTAIDAEVAALDAGIRQVDDLLSRASVKTPTSGTILETYAEIGEAVAPGKPLFKMADLDTLEMKAYFSSNQLASLKIGDEVEVLIDAEGDSLRSLQGKLSWIASNAEFTPKIIQTREERVDLVYAVKIRVPNDGSLRINMPGEVKIIK